LLHGDHPRRPRARTRGSSGEVPEGRAFRRRRQGVPRGHARGGLPDVPDDRRLHAAGAGRGL